MPRRELVERIRGLCRPMEPMPILVEPRRRRLPGITAVVFDVYGTMFISGSGDVGTAAEVARASALGESLAAAGFDGEVDALGSEGAHVLIDEIQSVHRKKCEAGVRYPEVEIREVWNRVVQVLQADHGLGGSRTPEAIEILAVEYECRVNPVWEMPGLRDVLASLRRSGYQLGIVSNAQFYTPLLFDALLNASVEELGFDSARCIWSYVMGEAKPSASLFKALLENAELSSALKPGGVLYVGNDMLNDMFTASEAGCRTALFAGDRRSLRRRVDDPRCAELEPDLVVQELNDLLPCLGVAKEDEG